MHIIDVRSKEEFEAGHSEGAVHFDVQRLIQGETPDIPPNEPIKVYCASGARSCQAKLILEMYGFTNVEDGGGFIS